MMHEGLSLGYFLQIVLKFIHDLELRLAQPNIEHLESIENNGRLDFYSRLKMKCL